MRISVRGSCGSGKSTFARRAAEILQIPHTELDSLHHMPGWQERPREEFFALVEEAAGQENWVIDGNYSAARNLIDERADTIVFLGYGFWLVFGRLLRRTWNRSVRGEPCCNGNYETLRMALSREGILWWFLTNFRRRREQCDDLFQSPESPGVRRFRFRTPQEAEKWLNNLSAESGISSTMKA
jgi:adenylate kinase family enzyme